MASSRETRVSGMNLFLLIVFIIHLVAAIMLYARKKDSLYLGLTVIFAILAGSVLVELFDINGVVSGVLISNIMRKIALALAVWIAVQKLVSNIDKRKSGC